jgi:hypothetical protein
MTATPKTKDCLMAAAQVAGVIAGAWFVWFHAALPRLGRESLSGSLGQSLFSVTFYGPAQIIPLRRKAFRQKRANCD